MPWAESAVKSDELVESFFQLFSDNQTMSSHKKYYNFHKTKNGEKPHGRVCYTLCIFSDFYIDLSVMGPDKLLM